jgi:hypothetical protein
LTKEWHIKLRGNKASSVNRGIDVEFRVRPRVNAGGNCRAIAKREREGRRARVITRVECEGHEGGRARARARVECRGRERERVECEGDCEGCMVKRAREGDCETRGLYARESKGEGEGWRRGECRARARKGERGRERWMKGRGCVVKKTSKNL